jgi:hypothetical protein
LVTTLTTCSALAVMNPGVLAGTIYSPDVI